VGEENDAVHHCDECDSFLCDSCKTVHTKSKGTRSHAVQTVAEFAASGGGVAQDGGAAGRMCAIHPDKPLEVFCNTCKKLICLMVRVYGLVLRVCARVSVRDGWGGERGMRRGGFV
jgi:hypothetical protein